jgi:uncharacterized membrane protein
MKILYKLKDNYVLIIILFLASILRIYHADFQSIWLDEVLTMNNSNPNHSLNELYKSVLFWEYIPHLYFYLVRFSFELFGYTTLVARLLSAIIGVFGVYAIYLLGKEIYTKKAGLIAALFLSVNVFHISYSQEIRPYGLLFLFTTLSFYRLLIFIKHNTVRNAVYYGIFTGLIINAHFFGFITIISQCILLLFILLKMPKAIRFQFFKLALISGITTVIIIAPGYAAIQRMFEINSFWLAPPKLDVYTTMFKEIFGNSEMLLFGIFLLFTFYIINVFSQKDEKSTFINLINNKILFGFIILFVWIISSLLIPLIKSYLDVSMIINRYFISIVAIFMLVLAIGTELIQNKLVKTIVITYVVLFSIVDLFVVKKYYTVPSKTQLRELTNQIKEKNSNHSKIVVFWGWIFPYFFQDDSQVKFQQNSLDEYVNDMRTGKIKPSSFWYADANYRPYTVTPENEVYLQENFNVNEKIDLYDAWARYYVSKIEPKIDFNQNLDLSLFSPAQYDSNGNMMFFQCANARTPFMELDKGEYDLMIEGNSLPAMKINGENAHLKIRINGKDIDQYYLSEDLNTKFHSIPFSHSGGKIRIQLIYDNDFSKDNLDRNVIIYSIKLKKK